MTVVTRLFDIGCVYVLETPTRRVEEACRGWGRGVGTIKQVSSVFSKTMILSFGKSLSLKERTC
jgi:hypothetical protein